MSSNATAEATYEPDRTPGIEGGGCREVRRRCRCVSAAATSAVADDSYGRGSVLACRDHCAAAETESPKGARAASGPRHMRPICDHNRQESSHEAARPRRVLPQHHAGGERRLPCISPVSAASRRLPPNAPERIRTSDLRFRRPTLYPAELRAQGTDSLAAACRSGEGGIRTRDGAFRPILA